MESMVAPAGVAAEEPKGVGDAATFTTDCGQGPFTPLYKVEVHHRPSPSKPHDEHAHSKECAASHRKQRDSTLAPADSARLGNRRYSGRSRHLPECRFQRYVSLPQHVR